MSRYRTETPGHRSAEQTDGSEGAACQSALRGGGFHKINTRLSLLQQLMRIFLWRV